MSDEIPHTGNRETDTSHGDTRQSADEDDAGATTTEDDEHSLSPGLGEGVRHETSAEQGETSTNEGVFLPEYNFIEYFPEQPDLSEEGLNELRAEYGYVRAFFMTRPAKHRDLQLWLNQARMGIAYDRYLEMSAYYSIAAGAIGTLVGAIVAFLLVQVGLLAGVQSPVDVGLFPRSLVGTVGTYKEGLLSTLIVVLSATVLSVVTWIARYYQPRQAASSRQREIDFVLPSAIVFMYALSRSGMNLVDIIEKVAASEEMYGEVAHEFETINREITFFGNDIYTALRNARATTPSDRFEQFLNDMVSLLDSGGGVTSFFHEESRAYLRDAREEQSEFLDILSILSEVFIVGFVAAPLFLIVILMVISLLGGSYISQMAVLIYVGLPLGLAGFAVLLSTLAEPFNQEAAQIDLEAEDRLPAESLDDIEEDSQFEAYQRAERAWGIWDRLTNPLKGFQREPLVTLGITGPIALLFVVFGVTGGTIPLTVDGWIETPIQTTNFAVVVPFLIVTVPLSVFAERKRRREDEIVRRFPDTLDILSSANNMGISLSDALDVVARWSTGRFAAELRTVRNDIQWNNDTSAALKRFANRLSVPGLARTVNLIAEGRRATSDLSEVLDIAAEDARNRYKMHKERKQELMSYLVVVLVGYFVFLGVIVLLNVSYLEPISRLAAGGSSTVDSPVGVSDVPVQTYRLLFFHATLVQGIGVGLISGLLADNSYQSGLKYAIGLVLVATVVFLAV